MFFNMSNMEAARFAVRRRNYRGVKRDDPSDFIANKKQSGGKIPTNTLDWSLSSRGVTQRIKAGVDAGGSIKSYFGVKVSVSQKISEIWNMGSEVEFEINVDTLEDSEANDSGISDIDLSTDFCNTSCDQTPPSKSRVPEDIRLRINSRERDRMHNLNGALDSLRQVLPHSRGPSVKKLSKLSTLLLARNYIVTLTKSLEELKNIVGDLSCKSQPVHSLQALSRLSGELRESSTTSRPRVTPKSRYSPYSVKSPHRQERPTLSCLNTSLSVNVNTSLGVNMNSSLGVNLGNSVPFADKTNVRGPQKTDDKPKISFSVESLLKKTCSKEDYQLESSSNHGHLPNGGPIPLPAFYSVHPSPFFYGHSATYPNQPVGTTYNY